MLRGPALHAVVGEHRVERGAAARESGGDLGDEIGRGEVEQRRGGDEPGLGCEHGFQVADEVGSAQAHQDLLAALAQRQLDAAALGGVGPGRETLDGRLQQGRVVIDERPVLYRAQERRRRPQVGAGTAAEVEDGDRSVGEMPGKGARQLLVARAVIDRLAQIEPARVEAAHGGIPPTPAPPRIGVRGRPRKGEGSRLVPRR